MDRLIIKDREKEQSLRERIRFEINRQQTKSER